MKVAHVICEPPLGRILLLLIVILFPLCSGAAHSASEPGTITVVVAEEPPDLDPGNSISQAVGSVLIKNIVEALTEVNYDDGSIIPKLAASWKQIDARTWHFFLRKGVKFHDGEDFNAEAVIFNLKRIYDKKQVREQKLSFSPISP